MTKKQVCKWTERNLLERQLSKTVRPGRTIQSQGGRNEKKERSVTAENYNAAESTERQGRRDSN